jgi:NAD(P)-dependent dehydrogenase (short-subunit alcohol dehydrogenase family)
MEERPVALITGCSTGIGYETALLLAREGYRVFAGLRDLKRSGPLRKAAAGLPLEILRLDVDRPGSVKKAVAEVLRRAGTIDLLVNNAGWGAFGALEEFTDEEIQAQFETNVFGSMRVTREVLPSMRARRSGRVLHIGSLAGKMTFAGIALYCSTKHAVEALTEGLRTELRPFGVEVAVIEPGNIKTPFKANRRKVESLPVREVLLSRRAPKGPGIREQDLPLDPRPGSGRPEGPSSRAGAKDGHPVSRGVRRPVLPGPPMVPSDGPI